MMQMRRRGCSILSLVLIIFLPAGSVRAAPHHTSYGDPAGHAAPGSAGQGAGSVADAPELALRLQAVLGQHSILAADFMRGRISGDNDFVQGANAALSKNTDAVSNVVGGLLGNAVKAQFAPMWSDHVVALFQYAQGLADQDDNLRSSARKSLAAFELEIASLFAGASHGRLTKDAAHKAILAHVDNLLGQADAYAAGDYEKAEDLYRDAYAQTFDLGRGLALALVPAVAVTAMQKPIWLLRSELGKLLAEHVELTVDVTRAAATNSDDFAGEAQALNGNTRDLAAAVDSLFGAAKARRFQSLWASHVEQMVAYSSAAAAHDTARLDQARTVLQGFEPKFASFLATATGRRLDAARLSKAMAEHDEMLLKHADAFAAKDYGTAAEMAYDTYQQMFDLARQMADAFGATVAARLPVGGAQTGYGGMAGVVGRR
jgi:hypothetical protein